MRFEQFKTCLNRQPIDLVLYILRHILLRMNFFIKLRNLLYIIRIFYWFSFKAVVKAKLQGHSEKAQQLWAKTTWEFFQSKLYKCTSSEEMKPDKTIILTNHRSQADFWIHAMITDYKCNFISRMAVAIVFFIFGIFANKVVWFFNRSGNIDHDKFNQWLNKKFSQSPRPSLLVYPEGHRMPQATKVQKEKLKTGLIKYAYRQKIPVQMLMSFGNETIFNEKKFSMGWEKKVYYSFSKVYNPETFDNERDFVNHMKDEFCNFFDQIWRIYTEGGAVEEVEPLRNEED